MDNFSFFTAQTPPPPPPTLTFTDGVLNCSVDTSPLFRNRMQWYCNANVSSLECNTYVHFEDEVLQVNPKEQYIAVVGLLNTFPAPDGIVNAYFTKEGMRIGQTFSWVLECSDLTNIYYFNATVTPEYATFWVVADRTGWLMDNAGYVFGLILMVFLVVIVLVWWYKKVTLQ